MRRVIASLAFFVALLVPATPAEAHTTSYCGHGNDGYYWLTEYVHSHSEYVPFSAPRHIHHYRHHWLGVYHHEEHRYC